MSRAAGIIAGFSIPTSPGMHPRIPSGAPATAFAPLIGDGADDQVALRGGEIIQVEDGVIQTAVQQAAVNIR